MLIQPAVNKIYEHNSITENVSQIVEIKHLTNFEKKKLQWQREKGLIYL